MKKKQPDQSASNPEAAAAKKAGIMTLLAWVSFILYVIATVCLVTATADLGIVDLTLLLYKYTWAFLTLLLISGLLCAFAVSQTSSANKKVFAQQAQTLNENLEGRMDLVDKKVQEYLGENYKKLKEQNEVMKTEFDQIREKENNKIIAEIEELRIENADLRKKLSGNNSINEDVSESENRLQVA